jgi:flagellar assembly factor FliW
LVWKWTDRYNEGAAVMTTSSKIEVGKLFFEEGLPGFSHLKFFELVQEEANSPIFSLHSLEDEQISFWLVDPFSFFKDYEFAINEQTKESLRVKESSQVIALNIASLRPNNLVTVNLKAPIVINLESKMAKQVILNDDKYNIRQPLFQLPAKEASK